LGEPSKIRVRKNTVLEFKMLNPPLGRLMIGKVDIQAMSDRTGMPLEQLIEGIKKNKVRLLILPKDINEKYIEQFKRLEESFEVTIINIEKKEEFLNVFSRNVNVVGITDKRVVNGILRKVEVTE